MGKVPSVETLRTALNTKRRMLSQGKHDQAFERKRGRQGVSAHYKLAD